MTTLSKEDIVRWADECVFDIMQADEYHAENEVIDSGNRWITDKMMAFATLSRADLVAENERLKAELSKHEAVPQYKEARRAEVAVLHDQLTATRTALAAAIAREIGVMKLMAEVESKYSALLKEQDAESEKFKAEGDMYGWNFHTGLRSGAVQMHLNMTTLIKAIAKPRDDSALREMIAGVYEECAKVCEAMNYINTQPHHCADAIRALAEKAKGE